MLAAPFEVVALPGTACAVRRVGSFHRGGLRHRQTLSHFEGAHLQYPRVERRRYGVLRLVFCARGRSDWRCQSSSEDRTGELRDQSLADREPQQPVGKAVGPATVSAQLLDAVGVALATPNTPGMAAGGAILLYQRGLSAARVSLGNPLCPVLGPSGPTACLGARGCGRALTFQEPQLALGP